jgi:hypothetical protein
MPLKLYGKYDRRAVHDIFDPSSPFTVGAGSWGILGIIRLPDRPRDFVLFVTLGKQEGAYQFDESINDQGILRWQSQPKQDLTSPAIADLIRHDDKVATVHLFLRTSRMRAGVAPPFSYLGPLRYHGHDVDRSQPAHIAWELVAWPISEHVRSDMQLTIVTEPFDDDPSSKPFDTGSLVEEEAPMGVVAPGESTNSFKARKVRYQSSDQSRALGLAGELLVLNRERARLTHAGRSDLAAKVEHTSVLKGDGAGYDIASFFIDGRSKYIEVKTTTGAKAADFLISPNEIAFSQAHADQFELCRVFGYSDQQGTARSYSLFGNMRERLHLVETQYRARAMIV